MRLSRERGRLRFPEFDLRSLALFRVGIALVLLCDLWTRYGDLVIFYTDEGVLSRAALLRDFGLPWPWPAWLMTSTRVAGAAVFWAGGFGAVVLLVGYRTRLATAFCWVIVSLLALRNPGCQQGGVIFERLLLFWGLFLPLGARFSVDHALDPSPPRPEAPAASWGTAAFAAQFLILYWNSVYYKLHDSSLWTGGEAVRMALSDGFFATRAGILLRAHEGVARGLTYSVLVFEAAGPIFLLSFWPGPVRAAAVFLFLLLQSGFAACLRVGIFPWSTSAGTLAFLPSWFWGRRQEPQSREALRDLPKPAGAAAGFFLGCLILYVLLPRGFPGGAFVEKICQSALIDQTWEMLTGKGVPIPERGWVVVPGRLEDGSSVDLFDGGKALSWAAPAVTSSRLRDHNWLSFIQGLTLGFDPQRRSDYFEFVCRRWNGGHVGARRLRELSLVLVLDKDSSGRPRSVPQTTTIGTYRCAAGSQPR